MKKKPKPAQRKRPTFPAPAEAEPMQLLPQLLTVSQVARLLNVSEKTVYTLVKQGELPRVSIGKLVRVRVASLNTWLDAREK